MTKDAIDRYPGRRCWTPKTLGKCTTTMKEIGRRLLDSFRLGFSSERRGRIFGVSITLSAFVWVDNNHGRSRIPTARLPIYVREREERISSGSVQIDQEPCRKAITVSRTLADDAKIVGTESSIPTLIGSENSPSESYPHVGPWKHPRRNPPRHDKVIEMIVVSDHGGRQDKTRQFPFSSHEVTYARGPAHVPSLQEGSEDRFPEKGGFFFLFKGALACHMHEHINR